ncbi:hypothetical protein DICSQDRAFT_177248 [Dichomitus squalens LYAD-421 SS1]|uniref:uncharacterized protein n=1 Tax=Dichomitus squalens (strain LYAD-421) TaxID=732165 RepID=UPI0004415031|nr:uncharacterized protein DICSQDRAFT_177248 [Dichomitus squalens LYAD-421 SS1]EJF65816.1 hypothetical protein DICSQDRAFT_177248 [Dichomitus squalens LYAD-421 SS1]
MPPISASSYSGDRALIPKPRKRPTSFVPGKADNNLASRMGLSHTQQQLDCYCQIVEDVAKLYDKHKDEMFGHGVRSDSPAFREQVRQLHPMLIDGYEDAWPIECIVNAHRIRRRDSRTPQCGIGLSNWTKHMGKASKLAQTSPQRRHSRGPTLGHPQERQRLAASYTEELPAHLQVSEASTPCSAGAGNSVSNPRNYNGTQSCGGLHKSASDPDSILAFLNSLSPALPALLPVFMVMGVNDPVTL